MQDSPSLDLCSADTARLKEFYAERMPLYMNKSEKPEDRHGKVEIFCRFIRRKGKIIYPKNSQFFHFWVTPKPKAA